jgi:hypothetical protein
MALFSFTILTMLVIVQERLSRGEHTSTEPQPGALWDEAQPPGQWSPTPTSGPVGARSAANCALLIATDAGTLYMLTSVETGVTFDIDADGTPERTAWTPPDSDVAFLALDQNGDGKIDSGKELVGDRTLPAVPNGPRALAQLTDPARQRATVDADGPLLAKLLLWRDRNHNGASESEELRPAQDELAAIGLGYTPHRRVDAHGNRSRYRGFVHVRTASGLNRAITPEDDRARRRYIYEMCFVTGE